MAGLDAVLSPSLTAGRACGLRHISTVGELFLSTRLTAELALELITLLCVEGVTSEKLPSFWTAESTCRECGSPPDRQK